MSLILAREVLVMFMLVGVGIICNKAGILTPENCRPLSNILMLVIIPATIVYSFQTERKAELLPGLILAFIFGVLYHALCVFVSTKLIRDPGSDEGQYKVARLGAVFSNSGFMGFPLLSATIGDIGLFYGAMFIAIFNVTTWVWASPLMSGERLSKKKVFTNPAILGAIIGVTLFLLNIKLPAPIYSTLGSLTGTNTPISMLVIGVNLATVSIKDAVRDARVYKVGLLRNILFPLATLLIMWALRVPMWIPGGKTFAMSFLISSSCSSAAMTILMPSRYGYDGKLGASIVFVTTLLLIITLPLLMLLAGVVL